LSYVIKWIREYPFAAYSILSTDDFHWILPPIVAGINKWIYQSAQNKVPIEAVFKQLNIA